tara:strand:- start:94 stop:627 length:534 start_codon:yes stop_codon:yes gene_type:complete
MIQYTQQLDHDTNNILERKKQTKRKRKDKIISKTYKRKMKLQFQMDDIHDEDCNICKLLEKNGTKFISKENMHKYQHHSHSTLTCFNHEFVKLSQQQQLVSNLISKMELAKGSVLKEQPRKKNKPCTLLMASKGESENESKVSEMEIINKFRLKFGISNRVRKFVGTNSTRRHPRIL